MTLPDSTLSPTRARLYVLAAALLWSTGGAFAKVLTQDTFFGFNEPALQGYALAGYEFPVQIACYRSFFAGMLLVPTLRPRQLRFHGLMVVMAIFFAIMSITFLSAQALGTAANAILLQYSAPLWVYLAGIFWLGEKPDRRSTIAMWLGLVGIGIIVGGGWQEGQLPIVIIALVSGVTYGGVMVCLSLLRDVSSPWLVVWNHLWSGLVLLPFVLSLTPPSATQMIVLLVYGCLQMGLPYFLLARGLRVVSAQEAGTITLLEPLLNPLWAYLVSPKTETPPWSTYVGGAIILATLAWRYWPRRAEPV